MKEMAINLSQMSTYKNAVSLEDDEVTGIDNHTNQNAGEEENYFDIKSEHAGEEEVDIGLKVSTPPPHTPYTEGESFFVSAKRMRAE